VSFLVILKQRSLQLYGPPRQRSGTAKDFKSVKLKKKKNQSQPIPDQ